MTDAALIVALANARADRRPTHSRHAAAYDRLADLASARELLAPFLETPLGTRDLPELRGLQREVVTVVDALVDGSPPALGGLNAIAGRQPTIHGLKLVPGGRVALSLRPSAPSGLAELVVAVVAELSELEPARLRRCARPECRLVFYDQTRSATQRWHAERPCGLRERQRRHRDRQAPR